MGQGFRCVGKAMECREELREVGRVSGRKADLKRGGVVPLPGCGFRLVGRGLMLHKIVRAQGCNLQDLRPLGVVRDGPSEWAGSLAWLLGLSGGRTTEELWWGRGQRRSIGSSH